MKYTFCLTAVLCLYLSEPRAQHTRALSVGDSVPAIRLKHIINAPFHSARLADWKDKLLILDFWATWCVACVRNIPKLDSLQRTCAGRLQILLVNTKSTHDSEDKIKGLLSNLQNNEGHPIHIPIVTQDSILDNLFPHKLIPHYVWLKNNKVLAITNAEEITASNIEKLFLGSQLTLVTKKDLLDFDTNKPLLFNLSKNDKRLVYSNAFFSGYIAGLSSKQGEVWDTVVRRCYGINRSILNLYQFASGLYENQLLVSSSKVGAPDLPVDPNKESWKAAHLFSYEITLPANIADSARRLLMIRDLNHYLELNAHFETRTVPCLVIKGQAKEIRNPETGTFHGTVAQLVHLFNSNAKNGYATAKTTVIDESTGDKAIKLSVPNNCWLSISALQQAIESNGLAIELAERPVSFLVIANPAK